VGVWGCGCLWRKPRADYSQFALALGGGEQNCRLAKLGPNAFPQFVFIAVVINDLPVMDGDKFSGVSGAGFGRNSPPPVGFGVNLFALRLKVV
jgi:hypothetical protein